MISIEESIPVKSDAFKMAENVFYIQFNQVNFYVEDDFCENLYFCVLKNLFPEIKFEKIFPLGGKDNVIKEARENLDSSNKIYIVDKDFDDILNKKEVVDNLFYIERYSIENFFLEEEAIVEYIIENLPRLSREKILTQFSLKSVVEKFGDFMNILIYAFIIVQEKELGIKNVKYSWREFCEIDQNLEFVERGSKVVEYINQVNGKIKDFNSRMTFNGQIKNVKKKVNINCYDSYLKHVPGKYLIDAVNEYLKKKYHLPSSNLDSCCYRVAKNCNFESLSKFKLNIEMYIAS